MAFKKAEKRSARLRCQLVGPSGSGKTWTALELAGLLKGSGRVAVVDSEAGSASKYADLFDFDVDELTDFSPDSYVKAIRAAEVAGYTVLVIDSMSHEWAGKGGVLEKVDKAAASGNKWAGWRVGTPAHNAFIDALLQSKLHVIATARAKTEWVLEENEKGKQAPKAVGLGAVQRDGVEYEFDVVVLLSHEHVGNVTKTRCPTLDGKSLRSPAPELASALSAWLGGKDEAPPPVLSNLVSTLEAAPVLAKIAAAQTQADLDALVGECAGLPDGQRNAARAAWVQRQAMLTRAA